MKQANSRLQCYILVWVDCIPKGFVDKCVRACHDFAASKGMTEEGFLLFSRLKSTTEHLFIGGQTKKLDRGEFSFVFLD